MRDCDDPQVHAAVVSDPEWAKVAAKIATAVNIRTVEAGFTLTYEYDRLYTEHQKRISNTDHTGRFYAE